MYNRTNMIAPRMAIMATAGCMRAQHRLRRNARITPTIIRTTALGAGAIHTGDLVSDSMAATGGAADGIHVADIGAAGTTEAAAMAVDIVARWAADIAAQSAADITAPQAATAAGTAK